MPVTFQNGVTQVDLTVAGIYGDSTFGNWLISLDTLASASRRPARDFFVIAELAEGVDPAEWRRRRRGGDGRVPAGQRADQRRVPRLAGGLRSTSCW